MVPSGPTVRKLAEAKQWVNNVSADHSIFYSSFPDANSLDVIDALGPHWFVIYDCVDLWNDFPNAKWYSLDLEKSIAQRANLVTCTSFALRDHCEALRKRQCDTAVKVLNNSTRIVGQPWVGERNVDFVYVGWIQDDWLDWDVVRDLADRGHSVRVLGPVQGEPPFTHRHVDWMGEIPGSSLMRYLSECKVGLIPFRDSPLVHAVDPIKSYDYAAAGLPVVASGFPELQDASHCFSVHREDFVAAAEDALIASWDREAIATYAEAHTAARRAEELTRWLDEEGAW
jgi:glycosyltransferase involved in cell wall biosynthesis